MGLSRLSRLIVSVTCIFESMQSSMGFMDLDRDGEPVLGWFVLILVCPASKNTPVKHRLTMMGS